MDGNGDLSSFGFGDGTVSSPSIYSFWEPTSGIMREREPGGSITIVKKGNKRLRVTDTGVEVKGTLTADSIVLDSNTLDDGSASTPALSFTSSTNSGFYYDTTAPAGLGFSVNGTKRMKIVNDQLLAMNGTSTQPAYSFDSDSKTGFFRSATNTIGVSNNGTNTVTISPTVFTVKESLDCGTYPISSGNLSVGAIQTTGQIKGPSNSIAPLYTFNGDTGTGMYSTAGGHITLGSGGTEYADFSGGGINTTLGLTSGALTTHGAINAGTNSITAGSFIGSSDMSAPDLTLDDGDQTTPSLRFTGHTQSGLYCGVSGDIGIASNGLGRFSVFPSPTAAVCQSGLTVNGIVSCGTNSLTCGAITSSALSDFKGGVLVNAGTTASPSIAFEGHTQSGFYSGTSGAVTISVNGVQKASWIPTSSPGIIFNDSFSTGTNPIFSGSIGAGTNSITCGAITSSSLSDFQGGILVPVGTPATPGLAFEGHTTSGLSSDSSGNIRMDVGGSNRLAVFGTGTPATISDGLSVGGSLGIAGAPFIVASLGTAAAPTVYFSGDTKSGLYSSAASHVDVTVGGSLIADFNSSGVTVSGNVSGSPILSTAAGSASAPAFSFTGDSKSGMYNSSAGALALTCSGTPVLAMDNTIITATVNITQPRYSIVANFSPLSTTQSIANATVVSVSFNNKKSGSNISFSNPTSRFTLPASGLYSVDYALNFAVNGTGFRGSWIVFNAASSIEYWADNQQNGSSATSTGMTGSCKRQCAANDTVEIMVYQNSGGALNIGNSGYELYISIDRLHE